MFNEIVIDTLKVIGFIPFLGLFVYGIGKYQSIVIRKMWRK